MTRTGSLRSPFNCLRPAKSLKPAAYLGIDLGTSGCRGMAIDDGGQVLAESRRPLPAPERHLPGHSEQDPELWWQAVLTMLGELAAQLTDHHPTRLAIDGTSASLLLTDAGGMPLGPALMYDDSRARDQLDRIARHAPAEAAVHSASASLAKLLLLQQTLPPTARHACHQAEWVANRLTGRHGLGDENNCLKLGYDPVNGSWPDWLDALDIDRSLLPAVRSVGESLGPLGKNAARLTGLPGDLMVVAGTTDSTAAALACGMVEPGDAVTSLGSTLVIKQLSDKPIFSPAQGVYSHKILGHWMVGGASNSGGAVLRHWFTDEEIRDLSKTLETDLSSGLDYYPLLRPGERFPINNPDYPPRITPIPENRGLFLQGLLEGIAGIEKQGYKLLQELGSPPLRRVLTAGGGSVNEAWRSIRQRLLKVPVLPAAQTEAAYGAALIARHATLATNQVH